MEHALTESKEERVQEAAERYRRGGYQVDMAPAPESLPEPLRAMPVDLAARSPLENIAVLVMRRADLKNPAVRRVAEHVQAVPDWRLDVFFYGPPEPVAADPPAPTLNREAVEAEWNSLRAGGGGDGGRPQEAFSRLWGVALSVLALLHPATAEDPAGLRIRQCYTDGYLSHQQYKLLWEARRHLLPEHERQTPPRPVEELLPLLMTLTEELRERQGAVTAV